MTQRTSRELLIAASALLGAFVALTLYVRFAGPIFGDRDGLSYARDHSVHGRSVADIYSFIGVLGTPAIGLMTTLAAAIIVFVNAGARPGLLVLASALIVLAEKPLSKFVGATDAASELGFPAGGYPSGHMLYATGVFGMLAVLGHRFRRPEVTFVAIVLVVAMAVQRVVTGAHLVDEVLAGALLGGAWLCVVLAVDAAR